MTDKRHMRHALMLADRALGNVAPNPAVGCVIVRDGVIVGRGWTQRGGRPHAEVVALKQAGNAARGATAYVTLEPCAHIGQTPPCANALIEAGVTRVVAAIEDPDPRVSGRGFQMLRDAGVTVETGLMRDEAAAQNAGFFSRITNKRPLVTLKLAISADNKIARAPGGDQWITGEEARRFAHLLRARHDAILAGIETVLADNPELTCRIPGLEDRSPVRVILDSDLRLPLASKLAQTANKVPLIIFTSPNRHRPLYAGDPISRGDAEVAEAGKTPRPPRLRVHPLDDERGNREDELKVLGAEVISIPPDAQGRPDLHAVLSDMASRGITRLLVEGGTTVEQAFLSQSLADRLEIFRSPVVAGEGGRPAPDFPLENYGLSARRVLGADVLESYAVRA